MIVNAGRTARLERRARARPLRVLVDHHPDGFQNVARMLGVTVDRCVALIGGATPSDDESAKIAKLVRKVSR
jgi:hypothetical protein